MQRTKIPYLTHTWNPIAMQCTPIATGCKNCWSIAMNKRFKNKPETPELLEKELDAPAKLRKPARIGVQFMGDLFHEKVPFEFIDRVYSTMRQAKQHTYQILTKRPKRLVEYCEAKQRGTWPDNIWFGVSCSTQADLDKNVPILLQIPAAVWFISLEPLLGDIDLAFDYSKKRDHCNEPEGWRPDWIIVGCESGPKRRPCENRWVRSIVQQCKAANVPVFVKQLDLWNPFAKLCKTKESKCSKDPAQWPEDLRVQEYPK